MIDKPLVYLAGKIDKNDWRTTLVPKLRGASVGQILDCEGFRYGGPYFISCDHGCFHGPESHGMRSKSCPWPESYSRWLISALSLIWVSRADAVFAWIDEDTCFGTLVELGWAAQMLRKPGFIGFRSDTLREQMWFAATGPGTSSLVFSDT